MKTFKSTLTVIVLALLLFSCEKEDNPDFPQYDHSLIFVKSNSGDYAIVNPVDGNDLYVVDAATYEISELAAGYMSKKAFITSHSGPGTTIKTLYACDAKTGDNLVAITNENELDVQRIAGSSVAPIVVFSADKVDNRLISFQIFTINEDGTNLKQLSHWKEGIECPGRDISLELYKANFPSWSPSGTKIAFSAYMRELPPANHPHDAIMIMDSDGDKKTVLYWVPKEVTGYEDICWTQDGGFLIFTMLENDFHRKVKVLNIENKKLTDITSQLEFDGVEVENIWTSPNTNRLVFNQHLGGGSDLFVAEYEINGTSINIKGTPTKITDKTVSGHKYYTPYWQIWDENK